PPSSAPQSHSPVQTVLQRSRQVEHHTASMQSVLQSFQNSVCSACLFVVRMREQNLGKFKFLEGILV
ncbi:MAG: hypothetical protein ORN21_03870, partial [Methylophilaceae bacterium]|nr:hypothetical protein [Methylophilaceae bacterium]